MIGEHEGCHGLHDGHCTWYNAGVVATFGLEFGGRSGGADRLLSLADGGHGFESHTEIYVFAIADAAFQLAITVSRPN